MLSLRFSACPSLSLIPLCMPAFTCVVPQTAASSLCGRTVYLRGHTGNNLQCSSALGSARCANANRQEWERITIKHVGNESYVLTSGRGDNGNNLQCQPNGDVMFANRNEQLWEMWGIEQKGDAVFFVSKHTHKVLQCAPNGAVRCENANRLGWEAFGVLEQSGTSVIGPAFVAVGSIFLFPFCIFSLFPIVFIVI